MIGDQINPTSYGSPQVQPRSRVHGPIGRIRHALRGWLAIETATAVAAAEDIADEQAATRDWPSLDVVYEEMQDSISVQNDRIKGIDTKANFGLAAATLLTAAVTGLGRALLEAPQQGANPVWFGLPATLVVDAVTIVSLGVYALIAFTTYRAYRIQTFKDVPAPQRLLDKYLYEAPEITKAAIARARVKVLPTTNRRSTPRPFGSSGPCGC